MTGQPGGDPGHRTVVFAIGSNLGDRLEYLQGAVKALAATPGLVVRGISPVYETAPVGLVDQPDFLNLVVVAESGLPASELLERGLAIEDAFDRVRLVPGGPRTVDVDLISVGAETVASPRLTLPHPRAHLRAFVLAPWLDADPRAVLVGHGRVVDLLSGLDLSGVRRRPELQVG